MADNATRLPQVTAIIVVRNGEDYIREAIDSILQQSFTDWELLIVDDASTDGTTDIVRSYERSLPDKVRLLFHHDGQNHGIGASRNRALGEARGGYIAFLDADDIWLPDKLSEQVAIMAADQALGMVYGRTLIWHSWDGSAGRKDFYYPLGVKPDARYEPPKLFKLLLENKAQTPTTCNALMRAELFARLGGFETSFRLMFEDQTFFAKALVFAPAYVASQTWAKYRQHSRSCSAISAVDGNDETARLAFLKWLNTSMIGPDVSFHVRLAILRTLGGAYCKAIKRGLKQLWRVQR